MKTCRNLVLAVAAMAVAWGGTAGIAQADWVVNNRTEHDLYVAVGKVEPGYTVDNIAQGTSHSEPSKIWARGWWKVNRYGGSVTIPWGDYANGYVYILGPGGRTHKAVQGAMQLPYSDKAFNFSVSLNDEKFATSGSLAKAARDKDLVMRSFAPVKHFRENSALEITVEKLGWNANNPAPPPKKPGGGNSGGGDDSVFVPTKNISVTFTNETAQTVTFVLKGGVGPGTATGLAKGQTKTHSLAVKVGTTPVVVITQPGGGSKAFTLQDKGSYAFRLSNGQILNYLK